jgi:hypothetical protein
MGNKQQTVVMEVRSQVAAGQVEVRKVEHEQLDFGLELNIIVG